MITAFRHFHKPSLFEPTHAWSPPASAKTQTIRRPAAPTSDMPASLWRHSQSEEAAQARHHNMANWLLLGLGGLSLGEVAHAIYQTCTLMADHRLHDAVAAFAR